MDELDSYQRPFKTKFSQMTAARTQEVVKHRRVRIGHLYYVVDPESKLGWSVVEIEGVSTRKAAFVPGQLEAVPLAELRGRILGPVPAPAE